jgi:hypothetical protein
MSFRFKTGGRAQESQPNAAPRWLGRGWIDATFHPNSHVDDRQAIHSTGPRMAMVLFRNCPCIGQPATISSENACGADHHASTAQRQADPRGKPPDLGQNRFLLYRRRFEISAVKRPFRLDYTAAAGHMKMPSA